MATTTANQSRTARLRTPAVVASMSADIDNVADVVAPSEPKDSARRSRYSDAQRLRVMQVYPFLRDTEDKEYFAHANGMTLHKLYNLASRLGVTRHYDDWFSRPDADDNPDGYNPAMDPRRLLLREPFDPTDAAWSPYEDAYLVNHFGKQIIEQVAFVLNRPESAIAYRARRLDLRDVAQRSHEDLLRVCQRFGIQTRLGDEERPALELAAELLTTGRDDDELHAVCSQQGIATYILVPVEVTPEATAEAEGETPKPYTVMEERPLGLAHRVAQLIDQLTEAGDQSSLWNEVAHLSGELRLRHAARYFERSKVCAWLGLTEDELEKLLVHVGSRSTRCCDRYGTVRITLVSTQTLVAILSKNSLGRQLIEKRGACGWFIREAMESVLEVRAHRRHWEPSVWISHGHTCLSPFAGLSFGLFFDGTDPHLIGAHLHPEQISQEHVGNLIN